MADEVDAPQQEEAQQEEEFDWAQFFMGEEAPTPQAQAPTPPPVEESKEVGEEDFEDDAEALKKQLAQLAKQVAETSKATSEMAQSARMTQAIDAWRRQASPAELEMADLLMEAKSPEELRTAATLVKRTVSMTDKIVAQKVQEKEREMQKVYGYPVEPTFQPIPEKDKYKEAIKDGDLDRASSLAMRGIFNT